MGDKTCGFEVATSGDEIEWVEGFEDAPSAGLEEVAVVKDVADTNGCLAMRFCWNLWVDGRLSGWVSGEVAAVE